MLATFYVDEEENKVGLKVEWGPISLFREVGYNYQWFHQFYLTRPDFPFDEFVRILIQFGFSYVGTIKDLPINIYRRKFNK